MSLYKELSNDYDIRQVTGIQFCILSAEQIVSRSVVEITNSETYNSNNGNDPHQGGLFDARMGVIDNNKVCQTCGQRNNFCPGHFGHINLAKPMFYTQFFPIVKNVLKCVCFNCSSILVDTNSPDILQLVQKKISRQKRYEAIFRLSAKEKKCRACGEVQPSISKDGMFKIMQEWKDTKKKRGGAGGGASGGAGEVGGAVAVAKEGEEKRSMNAEDVLRIFRRISDRDSEILGFHKKYNRPEDLICTVFPVPPPAVRPSVRNDTGQRSDDDLSHKLSQLVKYNKILAKKIEKNENIETYAMLLQYELATLIDNTQPGIPLAQQRTGRPIRSLIERLKGKEGRIRGNLMGKRVDFSARSVITPDPNISIDELGVPIKIAMNLTMPEVVNYWNIEKMRELVRFGPDRYPGAKYVRKGEEARTIRLKGADRLVIAQGLQDGDIVERHLWDGDYVLFNRQPSLHRSSMMAHRVRVMPYNTFRLNVMVTPSFNADFDGDEMNMHVAQSLQSHEELAQLAAVPTQIISPRECKPIISVVQDIVLGLYRLTNDRALMTRKQFFNLITPNPRCIGDVPLPSKDGRWSGHQLLSSIMPKKISVMMGNGQYDEDKKGPENQKHYIKIVGGEVKNGVFDKDIYQSRTHGIIHSIYNEYGPDETRIFFDNTQQLICNWLVLDGFSVGISDLAITDETYEEFGKDISTMKTKVYNLIKDIHLGKYQNTSTKNNHEDFEKKVNDNLNEVLKTIGKKGSNMIDENKNRLINMIKSKSKGNPLNVSQMIGCVGQQNVDGRRIPYGFDSRTLPHFTKYDDGPEARGFVESSFIRGLTPQELFFAAMGGREGLIDTAVQSVTGDTRIVIVEGGVSKDVAIGDWIDAHLLLAFFSTKSKVKRVEEKNMEILELPPRSVFVPTCDMQGVVTWDELTHVTRHDPGQRLFKMATESGREVTVADSKSLLIWNPEEQKLVEFESKDVRVGMSVPVTMYLPLPLPLPLHDVREHDLLTKENGLFVGIFLANGHNTSSDPLVREFCEAWILNDKSFNGSHLFLDREVPDEAFAGPKDYVIGIVKGFMSGDGWNEEGRGFWKVCPTKRLVEGMAFLFSRLGVFCEFRTTVEKEREHVIYIAHPYWEKLARLHDGPKTLQSHNPLPESHDVVLDPIVKIEILDPVKHGYLKLYDVTVPSTLNFALRNGLQVRDTSEVGYLQRKLVKAMEDCKVGFDMSVRNAAGSIVQYLYGDDGMDASKIESQKLHYINMTPGEVKLEYWIEDAEDLGVVLSESTLKNVRDNQARWLKRAQDMYQQVLDDRDFVIAKIFNYKIESNVLYPVSLSRTITIAKGFIGSADSGVDLDPGYVMDKIEELCEISVNPSTPGRGMQLFHILLRAYLSPKVVICRHRLTKYAFDYVVDRVREKFMESIAEPSEMVGVIAAQSLGEPATQLSQIGGSKIMISNNDGVVYHGEIGTFIDQMLEKKENKAKVIDLGNGSVVFDPEEDYHIIGVSNEEKTSWRRILQVSRHPANGGLVRIHTMSGKTTCATLTHSFLKRVERGIEPVKGSDLKVGDRVPIAKYTPCAENGINSFKIGDRDYALDRDFGWLCGAYVADGCINGTRISISKVIPEYQDQLRRIYKEKFNLTMTQYEHEGQGVLHGWDMSQYHGTENNVSCRALADFFLASFDTGSHDKRIAPWVNSAPLEFVSGLICGYFDGDGNVNCDIGKQMIRSASVSEELTQDIILLLTRVGIFSSKCRERHLQEPDRNDLFTTQISRKYARDFKERVGPMIVKNKAENLDKVIKYVEREDKLSCQEMIDQIPELGEVIASIGKTLALDGQSRNYGRWTNKEAIGRETLKKYLPIFEKGLEDKIEKDNQEHEEAMTLWSQIKEKLDAFNLTDESYMRNKKLDANGQRPRNLRAVMDLEEKLMVPLTYACSKYLGFKYIGNGNASTYKKKLRIQAVTLAQYLKDLKVGIEKKRQETLAEAADVRDDKLPVLRQALYSDVVWDEITEIEILPDPGEMVYDFTVPGNDSFMVDCGVLVHNTLNSVHHDTQFMLRVDGELKRTSIGEFVEEKIKTVDSKRIELHSNDTTLAWLKEGGDEGPIPSSVEVMSVDEDGRVIWDEVTAVTKHPVINDDGSNTLLNVKVRSGRWVIATKGESFVLRIDNKLQKVKGSDLKLGDALPILPGGVWEGEGEDEFVTKYIQTHITPPSVADEVFYDEIISIEEVTNSHSHVYDFTTRKTRMFATYQGILMYDTFHLAGVSSASKTVRGVPRLKELLSVSKNMKTPTMRIHFKDDIKYDPKLCLAEMNDIRIVRFKDIVTSTQIYFDPMNKLDLDQAWLKEHKMRHDTPWVLRMEFNKTEMLRFNLYIHSVKERLKGHYGNMIECYESDNNADQLVMRIHLKVAGNGGQESSDLLTDLKALEHTILEKLIIKGVEGIEQVSIAQSEKNVHDPVTNTYTKREESVVYTEGTNFRKILANDKVDAERIYTNNVIEVYEVLGIEAARQAMFNEIMIVLEAVTVNYRHVALLVDYQTNKGALMSIDRHGINRGDIGPLAKCSFEESTDKLIKAGIFAEYDKINGVSANIMLGQITPAGTGDVTLIMDEDKLPLHPSSETKKDKGGEKEKEKEKETETANQCAFEFDFVVPRAADL